MKKHDLISVNIAVLLFGLAGLFAKWIHLPAICITFGRVLFSSLALGLYMLARKKSFRIVNRKDALLLVFAGAILAVHWWSFLQSIQLSTVAIGTITFSSFPLFVTFLEPLVFHKRPDKKRILLALIILIGVIITIPEFSFNNGMFSGIMVGMGSALSYAVLTVINKRMATEYESTHTAFFEQATAALFLLPFMFGMKITPGITDISLLLLLGIVMTALAHTLFISSLKTLPASLAGIISSLETVYSILFALLFLKEVPGVREILGAVIIIGAVIAANLSKEKPESEIK